MAIAKTACNRRLVILPGLAAATVGDRVVLTRKFVEGMEDYARRWLGPVQAVMHPTTEVTNNLDNVEVDPKRLGFDLVLASFDGPDLGRAMREASLVVGVPDHRVGMATLAREVGVPIVLVTENSLRTRLQIVAASQKSLLRRVRSMTWEWGQERRNRVQVHASHGLQCNGIPTYEAYRAINPRPMVFFDTRMRSSLIPSRGAVEARQKRLLAGGKLRLVFSGRLIAIKGVVDLVQVAQILRRRGVDFELSIYGDGDQAALLRQQIAAKELAAHCRLAGAVDFESVLVPFLCADADLFVCCHQQGDPSCTYMETLACGVPIVGYGNEAWAGMAAIRDVGWSTRLGDVAALADTIARLHADRRALAERSETAWQWGTENSFEATFQRRMDHFQAVAESAG